MKTRKFLADFAIYGANNALIKLVALFALPIISRVLTVAEFGVVETLNSVFSLLPLLIGLGYDIAVKKDVILSNQGQEYATANLFSTVFRFLLFWGALIVGGLFLARSILSNFFFGTVEYSSPIAWGLVGAYCSLLTGLFLTLKRSKFDVAGYGRVNLGKAILEYAFVAAAVMFVTNKIVGYFVAVALANAVIVSIALYQNKAEISGSFDRRVLIGTIRFGFPTMLAGLAYWVFNVSDRIMLTKLSVSEETGYYGMAMRLVSVLVFIVGAFQRAWIPRAFELWREEPDDFSEILERIQLYCIAVFAFLAVCNYAAAELMIRLLSTSQFQGSMLAVGPLACAYIFYPVTFTSAIGIYISEKTKYITVVSWFAAFLNIGLNFVIVPQYGAFGAGISTLLSYAFIFLAYNRISNRIMGWRVGISKPIGIFFVAAMVLVYMSRVQHPNIWITFIARGIAIIPFCLMLFVFRLLDINDVLPLVRSALGRARRFLKKNGHST